MKSEWISEMFYTCSMVQRNVNYYGIIHNLDNEFFTLEMFCTHIMPNTQKTQKTMALELIEKSRIKMNAENT